MKALDLKTTSGAIHPHPEIPILTMIALANSNVPSNMAVQRGSGIETSDTKGKPVHYPNLSLWIVYKTPKPLEDLHSDIQAVSDATGINFLSSSSVYGHLDTPGFPGKWWICGLGYYPGHAEIGQKNIAQVKFTGALENHLEREAMRGRGLLYESKKNGRHHEVDYGGSREVGGFNAPRFEVWRTWLGELERKAVDEFYQELVNASRNFSGAVIDKAPSIEVMVGFEPKDGKQQSFKLFYKGPDTVHIDLGASIPRS